MSSAISYHTEFLVSNTYCKYCTYTTNVNKFTNSNLQHRLVIFMILSFWNTGVRLQNRKYGMHKYIKVDAFKKNLSQNAWNKFSISTIFLRKIA